MKRLIFSISLLFLCLNILFGLILTEYQTFNVCVNSGVIMINTALLLALEKLKPKDAFSISLSVFIIILGFIQFILGLVSPPSFVDNWHLITMIIITVFEIILMTMSKYVTRIVK